jgi:uncharacterized protein (TIGR00369 family)
MATVSAPDPNFEARVRASFARQRVMATIGATMTRVEPGLVAIELAVRPELTQQHGFVHAGIVATIGDSACGYAAFSLMPADAGVLTVEYKINLLAPAAGDRLVAIGRIIRAGRAVTVCQADVTAASASGEHLVATLLATVMTIRDRPDVAG